MMILIIDSYVWEIDLTIFEIQMVGRPLYEMAL